MKDTYKESLRLQIYRYLYSLCARIRFTNGGRSNLEITVQPDVRGNGVFLYLIDNGRDKSEDVKQEKYVRLTPKNARRLAHALLFLAGESEIDESDETLTLSEKD